MSKYTTQIRFICESLLDKNKSEGYNSINEIIKESAPKIFNFDYPIFDEAYRDTLQEKILKHFYTREIGLETYGLWKLNLDRKLNEIMPYYNQLYETTVLTFNPLYDVDYTTTRKIDGKENGSNEVISESGVVFTGNVVNSETGSENNSKNVTNGGELDTSVIGYDLYSDTPQGSIAGIDTESYLTNATKNHTTTVNADKRTADETEQKSHENSKEIKTKNDTTENGTKSTTNEVTNTQSYEEHVVGKRGGTNYIDIIKKLRSSLINIDMMIIGELEDLFMQIW